MMARAKIDYSTWPTRELIAERRALLADTAPTSNRAQIGHIGRELDRRKELVEGAHQARQVVHPEGQSDRRAEWLEYWHLLVPWRPEGAGPLRKPNRILSVLRDAFGVRQGRKLVEDHLPTVLGYTLAPWRAELDRRRDRIAASRKTLVDEAQREEFQAWERVFAQRVADARAAGARTDNAAAGVVAAQLAADIRSLLVDGSGAVRPDMQRARDVLDGNEADGFDLTGKLQRAIYDVTRKWRARTSGTGKRAVPVIRPRVRDLAQTAALEEVLRAALLPGRNS